ncbi:GNAT family N-acetyltransferase [Boudabousia marimammalium]|uniref:N-acetyltransferase domain-containing protein n=1 Tax=Boudabousia marimammalium TaxID=156892 RepID=A0A1Q5PQX9_9ACTO|nr:GNAT family N-acetyltransferase [Boudabousia marimammalium]OKL50048.1 hypothetical protein BM477_03950 [Boudabousia marimammalium]
MTNEIRTERLILRTPTLADTEAVYEACQDEEIAKWTGIPFPYERANAESFLTTVTEELTARGGRNYGVYLSDNQTLVATLALRKESVGGSVGYWTAPQYRGQGFMVEAVKAACAYAFETLGWPRIEWRAGVGNWASRKVAWKAGFKFEGVSRRCEPRSAFRLSQGDDPLMDAWVGSLLPGEKMEPRGRWHGPISGQNVPVVLADANRPDDLVRQFHQVYGLPVVDAPDASTDRIHMRMGLILEETAELVGAAYGQEARELIESAWVKALESDDGTRDIVEIADALADIVYVVYGAALELGIDLPAVLSQVQASNMSKLMPDGSVKYREDGKVLKGPDFFGPEIAKVLGLGN